MARHHVETFRHFHELPPPLPPPPPPINLSNGSGDPQLLLHLQVLLLLLQYNCAPVRPACASPEQCAALSQSARTHTHTHAHTCLCLVCAVSALRRQRSTSLRVALSTFCAWPTLRWAASSSACSQPASQPCVCQCACGRAVQSVAAHMVMPHTGATNSWATPSPCPSFPRRPSGHT